MTDYSYITRAMLGLTDLNSMRYTGSLAVGVKTDDAATGTIRVKVGDPSHMLLESSTVTETVVELPGHDVTDGKLVDGLTYCLINTKSPSGTKGSQYKITIKHFTNGASTTLITSFEQDSVTVMYSQHHDRWIVSNRYNNWG